MTDPRSAPDELHADRATAARQTSGGLCAGRRGRRFADAHQRVGRGIDAKDFERIFELFRRSGEQDTQGEGIGLAYVRNLARRLGGEVTVRSVYGEGSTFTLTLPIVPVGERRAAA